jgi:hypothetical protein
MELMGGLGALYPGHAFMYGAGYFWFGYSSGRRFLQKLGRWRFHRLGDYLLPPPLGASSILQNTFVVLAGRTFLVSAIIADTIHMI